MSVLSHADPPRDLQLTAFLETQRGRLAIFEGSVASNPPAQLALYRGEELVASSSAGHSTNPRVSATAAPNALRVEVRDVTLADEGTYRLAATNAHGTVSQHLYFRVQGEHGRAARALCVSCMGWSRWVGSAVGRGWVRASTGCDLFCIAPASARPSDGKR